MQRNLLQVHLCTHPKSRVWYLSWVKPLFDGEYAREGCVSACFARVLVICPCSQTDKDLQTCRKSHIDKTAHQTMHSTLRGEHISFIRAASLYMHIVLTETCQILDTGHQAQIVTNRVHDHARHLQLD